MKSSPKRASKQQSTQLRIPIQTERPAKPIKTALVVVQKPMGAMHHQWPRVVSAFERPPEQNTETLSKAKRRERRK